MINIGREIQVLWSFFLPFSFAIKFSVELLLLSDRFERAYGKKKKRRRKRRWIDSLFQRLSRFQIKWNRCSHSLVLITPCLYVYVWARASTEREREKRGEIVRKCSLARLAHQHRARRISQGRSISLLAQIQTHQQFIPDCFFYISYMLSILMVCIYGQIFHGCICYHP
jgi:hypothetical protein